jgi:hypothetical protein
MPQARSTQGEMARAPWAIDVEGVCESDAGASLDPWLSVRVAEHGAAHPGRRLAEQSRCAGLSPGTGCIPALPGVGSGAPVPNFAAPPQALVLERASARASPR